MIQYCSILLEGFVAWIWLLRFLGLPMIRLHSFWTKLFLHTISRCISFCSQKLINLSMIFDLRKPVNFSLSSSIFSSRISHAFLGNVMTRFLFPSYLDVNLKLICWHCHCSGVNASISSFPMAFIFIKHQKLKLCSHSMASMI